MLHWIELVQQRVSFVTVGPNVAKGHVNIKCPFCGTADPSEHLGINLTTGHWGCWRDKFHRGKRPHRLLRRLFGWTLAETQEFLGEQGTADRSSFNDVIAQLKHPPVPTATSLGQTFHPTLPPEIHPLIHKRLTGSFVNYLAARKLNSEGAWKVYDLHYALTGKWAQRVVIPVKNMLGELQTWTGRAIGKKMSLRYQSASEEDGAAPITDFVLGEYWLNRSGGGRVLCVTEGPFDAMALDWLGRDFGVRATCVFGSAISWPQKRSLAKIRGGFDAFCVAMDEANLSGTLREWSAMADLRPIPRSPWRKDFGEMSVRELKGWCEEILSIV